MSCCEVSGTNERIPGTGCCGSTCSSGKRGCLASEPYIRSCLCQENVGCLDRADCGGFRPTGTAATGACPGPCQCAEEEAWNRNIPPKPNCEWLSNFSELRRQWSDHSRKKNCKCCNCRPCRKAAPCKPCSQSMSSNSGKTESSRDCQGCGKERLSGGGSAPRSNNSSSAARCLPQNYNSQNHNFEAYSSPSQFSQPSLPSFQPSSNNHPCSPSPRSSLKKRSCCQCISGSCMCQPMPRNCNCPPPVQVDAKAENDCSCDCPSSPECACPPSERRFARSRIRCPNAKMCCPLPRLPPGPKCLCSECQPCLPPPCDSCTSRKCKTIPPKMSPCQPDSKCPTSAACRPASPTKSSRSAYRHPPRDLPPCTSCRKMSLPYHDNYDEPLQSQVRVMNRPRSSYSRPGIVSDYRSGGCCCTSLETQVESKEEEYCDSFMCPVCLSLHSSTPAKILCQDCKNELHMRKFSEFATEFEDKSGQNSDFFCIEESREESACEEQTEESFSNEDCNNESAEVAGCAAYESCCKSNNFEENCEEGKNKPEIESTCKEDEKNEDEYIDHFEDDLHCCRDDPSSPCNATEQLGSYQKQNLSTKSLTDVGTNPRYPNVFCSENNLLIQKKTSATFSNEGKLTPFQHSAHNFTDTIICHNKNRETTKTRLLKSEDQFKSKEKTPPECESYSNNRKTVSCKCKDNEPAAKVRSSRNNTFHYKDTSFFDGWNNLKNALGSYFQNRISPNSSKPEEKVRNEYKSRTSLANREEIRKMDLNEKERKDAGTQNSQPRGDFCLKITNINRLDSFQNSRKSCNHAKRSKQESKRENKVENNKGTDQLKKYTKDKISAESDCTISWSSDRALINIQPENNADMIVKIDMQPKENSSHSIEISDSGENADISFPDDSIIITNEDKINSAIDVTKDNLSESSSNECLVHPRKDNCISECEFRRNDNDRQTGNGEFKQEKNFHSCSTFGFEEIKKKEILQDPTQRRNFFQGIKFTTSKVQNPSDV